MKRKITFKILWLAGIIIYVYFIISLCRYIKIDSDKANHLLQAADILSGNFFLRDWNLTGVTFLTTDLIFYGVANLIFGTNANAIYVCGGLMAASALIMASFLCYKKNDILKDKIFKYILYILGVAFPCQALLLYFRVHTVAVFFAFLCFWIVDIVNENETSIRIIIKFSILYFIICCMGSMGDMLFDIYCIFPVICLCIYRIVYGGKKVKKYIFFGGEALSSVIIGYIGDKLYFIIGKSNKNSYIGNKNFTAISDWRDKVNSFVETLSELSMADFGGHHISDFWNLLKIINFLVLLIGLSFIIYICYMIFFKRQDDIDDCNMLLCLSILFAFMAYVLTDLARPRYITLIPVASFVLVIRNIEWIINSVQKRYQSFLKLCFITLVALCFFNKIHEIKDYAYPDYNNELIQFLKEHNLEYGYASFWGASNNTIFSENTIKIRHIKWNENNSFTPFMWFNKNEWYTENANFVLVINNNDDRGESDIYDVSEKNIIEFFGNPIEKYEISNYIILIYNENLSQKLSTQN